MSNLNAKSADDSRWAGRIKLGKRKTFDLRMSTQLNADKSEKYPGADIDEDTEVRRSRSMLQLLKNGEGNGKL